MTGNLPQPTHRAGRRADRDDRPAALPGLAYIEQTVADLRYYLFDGRLPRERFPILAERRLTLAWAEVTLRIVGASHVCELATADGVCTEALVCAPAAPGEPVAVMSAPADRAARLQASLPNVAVGVQIERRRLTVAHRIELTAADANAVHAEYPGTGSAAGLTRLEWRPATTAFRLVTYHSYPADGVLIVTRSVFAARPAGTSTRPDAPLAAPGA